MIIITQSLQEEETYFIFREIGNNQYKEIKFRLENQKIVCSNMLKPDEIKFIEENISQNEFKIKDSVLNFRPYDSNFHYKKTKS